MFVRQYRMGNWDELKLTKKDHIRRQKWLLLFVLYRENVTKTVKNN